MGVKLAIHSFRLATTSRPVELGPLCTGVNYYEAHGMLLGYSMAMHGRVVRLTVCESDDPSSNPAQCSFLFVFPPLFLFFLSLLAWVDICAAEVATFFFFSSFSFLSRSLYWLGRTYDSRTSDLGVRS